MDKWISVKDELPGNYKDVILLNNGEIGIGYYDVARKSWYDYTRGDYVTDRAYNVTHWMPTPKLPEEDASDEIA